MPLGGLFKYVTRQISEFFFFFCALFVTRPGCNSLPIGTIHAPKRVFLPRIYLPFGGLDNI